MNKLTIPICTIRIVLYLEWSSPSYYNVYVFFLINRFDLNANKLIYDMVNILFYVLLLSIYYDVTVCNANYQYWLFIFIQVLQLKENNTAVSQLMF